MLSLLHGMIYKSSRAGREVSWESQEQAVKKGLSYVQFSYVILHDMSCNLIQALKLKNDLTRKVAQSIKSSLHVREAPGKRP